VTVAAGGAAGANERQIVLAAESEFIVILNVWKKLGRIDTTMVIEANDIQSELEAHLRFETLLAEISAQFVNQPADRIDTAIREAQRRICELLELDRSVLWQLVEREPGQMVLSHIHQPAENLLPASPFDARDILPWLLSRILGGNIVTIGHLKDLPPEAEADREVLNRWGVKSATVVPLSVGGTVIGALSFASLHQAVAWPARLVQRIQLVAQIFTNALARKQAEVALEFRLRFETLLSEISARFVHLPADQVDTQIEDAQRQICECLGLDLSALWQWSDHSPNSLTITHLHSPPEGPLLPEGIKAEESFPWTLDRVLRGELLALSTEQLPPEAALDRETFRYFGVQSSVIIPLSTGRGPLVGVLSFDTIRAARSWPEQIVRKLHLVAQIFANALARKQNEEKLRARLQEIEGLKQKLEKENLYLREEIELKNVHEEIVGRSPAMKRILAQVEQVAHTDATVLIEGETGTGKELLARAVHQLSTRKDLPLVTVNCAALPPTLIESELFGREKGAYTGALTRMRGRFEAAHEATLFLDEIGDLPLGVQAKLLRVLEQGKFERLGSTQTIQVNVRIITATNLDLAQQVAAGRFRKDLYFRLNVFPILLPPLRERSEDIAPLVWAFVRQYEKKMGKRIDHIPRPCMGSLQRYAWPGNIRELRNVVERALIVCNGRTLAIGPPQRPPAETRAELNLADAERQHITAVLQQTGGRLAGQDGAAEILGLKRTTLQSKMKKLGIRRPTHNA